MQIESLFGTFPVVASKDVLLKKVEEHHLPELFSIYDNDTVFQYCIVESFPNITSKR